MKKGKGTNDIRGSNGHKTNGHKTNGHGLNGHGTNGHGANGRKGGGLKPKNLKVSGAKEKGLKVNGIKANGNGQLVLDKNYRPSDKEPFMNERQRDYFRQRLMSWREEIRKEAKETLQHLQDENQNHSDIADRDRKSTRLNSSHT